MAYAPVIFWIGIIFYLSSDQGSMSETSRFIGPILEFFFPNSSEATIKLYHGYIRKAAHFTEYAILALLAARACGFLVSHLLRRSWYLLPLALVVLVATADEIGQSFRPSRTASVLDVLIDISGGLFIILVLWLLGKPRVKAPEPDAPAASE